MSQPKNTPSKNTNPTLTGAEILWATLVGEGVTTVFGYPGGAILPAYDALRKFPIHHVLVRHEQGAAHMADGYARASGRAGVCIATSGPGATNLVTGIATAMLDSIPIVCITGQVSSKVLGTDAFQEIDITGITLPITKHNFLVTRAEDIAPTIREAFQIAASRPSRPRPRRHHQGRAAGHRALRLRRRRARAAPPASHAPRRVRLHQGSHRPHLCCQEPVILAGHGIIHSGARDQVIAFAESRNIPVASTLLGLGAFPTDHPLALGMMGMHGESWVNTAIQESDLLLAFGMRFDDRVTGNLASYAPHAKKIHIEIDPSEIDKNVRADVALIGDLKEVLETLLPLLPPMATSDAQLDSATPGEEIAKLKGDASVRDIVNLPDLGHLYAAHVIHDIWAEARDSGRLEQTIIVTDVGQHQMWEAQYFRHDTARSLITSGGLGTMGFALPAAIGAKFACPEKDVWVIAGDGGFQMTASELATIQQEKIAINIAVINNGFLGMVRQWQEIFYDKNYACTPILSPDFVLLAAAHGIAGATSASARPSSPPSPGPHQRQALPHQLPGREGRRRLPHDRPRRRPPRNGPPPRRRPPPRNPRGRIAVKHPQPNHDVEQRAEGTAIA